MRLLTVSRVMSGLVNAWANKLPVYQAQAKGFLRFETNAWGLCPISACVEWTMLSWKSAGYPECHLMQLKRLQVRPADELPAPESERFSENHKPDDLTGNEAAETLSRHLAAIVECSDDAILSKDLNGIIRSWNHGAEKIFGYTAAEVIGKPVTILMPPERQNEEGTILARIRKGEQVHHFQTIRQRKNGTLVNISLTISPIKDSRGTIIGASKIARDITPQKHAEDLWQHFRAIVESSDDAILS